MLKHLIYYSTTNYFLQVFFNLVFEDDVKKCSPVVTEKNFPAM